MIDLEEYRQYITQQSSASDGMQRELIIVSLQYSRYDVGANEITNFIKSAFHAQTTILYQYRYWLILAWKYEYIPHDRTIGLTITMEKLELSPIDVWMKKLGIENG